MAISDNLPRVEVAITVNGQDLKEYIDPDLEEDDRTTVRYIEAVSGQGFAIRCKVRKGFKFIGDALDFRFYVDGNEVRRKIAIYEHQCYPAGQQRFKTGIRVSDTQRRTFEFASLETVSDSRMRNDEVARVKGLGTIKIAVFHSQTSDERPTNSFSATDLKEAGIVSEKALKGQAISHSIGYRAPERSLRSKHSKGGTDRLPGFKHPVAKFVFKYRSIENLKIEGIIPRTPTPPPLEDRDFETLTSDEIKELQRRARAFRDEQEAKIKIKREKAEEHTRRRKVARPGPGAIQLEVNEDGGFRESSTATFTEEQEVIELD